MISTLEKHLLIGHKKFLGLIFLSIRSRLSSCRRVRFFEWLIVVNFLFSNMV